MSDTEAATNLATLLRETSREVVHSDVFHALRGMQAPVADVVFADPPYWLSNGGTTCRGGKRTAVDKGAWDRPTTPKQQLDWTQNWLELARGTMKPTGSIWISGTLHSAPTVGYALQLQGFRILNTVTVEKSNPPPNLGCRMLTHSHETLIWASLGPKSKHHFDYEWARAQTGKQMKDVWRFNAPPAGEKLHGKHPTQKTVGLVERCLMLSCPDGGLVVDPFFGGGTTGVAAIRCAKEIDFIGIDRELEWCDLARKRIAAERAAITAREDLAMSEGNVPDRDRFGFIDPTTKAVTPV